MLLTDNRSRKTKIFLKFFFFDFCDWNNFFFIRKKNWLIELNGSFWFEYVLSVSQFDNWFKIFHIDSICDGEILVECGLIFQFCFHGFFFHFYFDLIWFIVIWVKLQAAEEQRTHASKFVALDLKLILFFI